MIIDIREIYYALLTVSLFSLLHNAHYIKTAHFTLEYKLLLYFFFKLIVKKKLNFYTKRCHVVMCNK